MTRRRWAVHVAIVACAIAVSGGAIARAQRGQRNAPTTSGESHKLSRLELMAKAFTLDADQTKAFKDAFDEGEKEATDARAGLITSHTAIGLAIQDAKGQAAIDDAVFAYASQAATMTAIEVKSLAKAMKSLHTEQLANKAATESVLGLLHGIFLDKNKWDIVPEGKTY